MEKVWTIEELEDRRCSPGHRNPTTEREFLSMIVQLMKNQQELAKTLEEHNEVLLQLLDD